MFIKLEIVAGETPVITISDAADGGIAGVQVCAPPANQVVPFLTKILKNMKFHLLAQLLFLKLFQCL